VGLTSAQALNITAPKDNSTLLLSPLDINITWGDLDATVYDYNCTYKLDNYKDYISCFSPGFNINSSTMGYGIGMHNLTIYKNESDKLNKNISIVTTKSLIYYFKGLPSISILYPSNGTLYSNKSDNKINFTFTDTSNSTFTCWLFNGTVTTNAASCFMFPSINIATTTFNSILGINIWTVFVNDSFGNIANLSTTFTLDNTKPEVTSLQVTPAYDYIRIHYHANKTVNSTIKYSWNSSNLNYSVSEADFATEDTLMLSGLLNGTAYYFNLTICDLYNNCFMNATYYIVTNASLPTPVVVNNTCLATYSYGPWNECKSDGTQIRTFVSSNASCPNPAPVIRQGCEYIPPNQDILTMSAASAINNTNSTGSGGWGGLASGWKILIIITIVGVICGLAYWLYSMYAGASPGDVVGYDPMGGYGIQGNE
jgi:hypothetical protein